MDAQLKQRVVGAAVLVALGVIFIPLMLDNGDDPGPAVDLDIGSPAPADFNSRVIPIDDETMDRVERALDAEPDEFTGQARMDDAASDAMADDPVIEPAGAPVAEAGPEPEAEPEPETPPAPVPSLAADKARTPAEQATSTASQPAAPPRTGVTAWVVQVGSFTTQANADGLVQRLKQAGYTAFIEPLGDGDKPTYRVRVGPELTKLTAERIRDEIAQDIELKGIVMRYP